MVGGREKREGKRGWERVGGKEKRGGGEREGGRGKRSSGTSGLMHIYDTIHHPGYEDTRGRVGRLSGGEGGRPGEQPWERPGGGEEEGVGEMKQERGRQGEGNERAKDIRWIARQAIK